MFYDDDGIRDLFIYGSVAMLAALAIPSKKAHAAEFYLCGDGRMLELTQKNRDTMLRTDTCVTQWHLERQKVAAAKSNPNGAAMAAAGSAVLHSTAYQIQTSAIEPPVNAEEVPEGQSLARTASRDKPKAEKRAAHSKKGKAKATRTAAAHGRDFKGLRDMGGGVFAE